MVDVNYCNRTVKLQYVIVLTCQQSSIPREQTQTLEILQHNIYLYTGIDTDTGSLTRGQ